VNDNQSEDKLTASGSEDSDDEGSQVNLMSELVLPCSCRAVNLLVQILLQIHSSEITVEVLVTNIRHTVKDRSHQEQLL